MAQITLQGNPIETIGELPAFGMQAPSFKLTKTDLTDVGPQDFAHKNVILNIFPSIDTSVCAASVRRFNKEASESSDSVVSSDVSSMVSSSITSSSVVESMTSSSISDI